MLVFYLELELLIPWAQSLKDRRAVVRSITDSVRASFNVSVMEDSDDHWQRTTLVFCGLTPHQAAGDRAMDTLLSFCERRLEGEVQVKARVFL